MITKIDNNTSITAAKKLAWLVVKLLSHPIIKSYNPNFHVLVREDIAGHKQFHVVVIYWYQSTIILDSIIEGVNNWFPYNINVDITNGRFITEIVADEPPVLYDIAGYYIEDSKKYRIRRITVPKMKE